MRISKTIDAPAEAVWKILTDTDLWPVWGPSVASVASPQRWISKGVKGSVKTSVGVRLPFEITLFEAPVYWHWKVAGIPATGHRLVPLGPERCKLIFEFPLCAFPYLLVCRRAAQNIAKLAAKKETRAQDGG